MHIYRFVIPALCLSILLMQSSKLLAEDNYCDWQSQPGPVHLSVNQPLCGLTGNAQRGREVAINRQLGNCLSCHTLPAPEEDFHGQIGPPLHGVALRYTPGELRLRLIDATMVNPMTIMPGFYRHPDNNHRLAQRYLGKTMLRAQQVEDLVAFLMTLDDTP